MLTPSHPHTPFHLPEGLTVELSKRPGRKLAKERSEMHATHHRFKYDVPSLPSTQRIKSCATCGKGSELTLEPSYEAESMRTSKWAKLDQTTLFPITS
eukprot:2868690-Amphidinium_carterae.1